MTREELAEKYNKWAKINVYFTDSEGCRAMRLDTEAAFIAGFEEGEEQGFEDGQNNMLETGYQLPLEQPKARDHAPINKYISVETWKDLVGKALGTSIPVKLKSTPPSPNTPNPWAEGLNFCDCDNPYCDLPNGMNCRNPL